MNICKLSMTIQGMTKWKMKSNDTGVRRIDDPNERDGYREICETRAAWDRRRRQCCDRARASCEDPSCQRFAPFKNTDEVQAGDAHHLSKRKVRNDRLYNLRWLCRRCHTKAHNPAKVLPASSWRKELEAHHANRTPESNARAPG